MVAITLAVLCGVAEGQRRLTDEECHDLIISEGAAAFRSLTNRQTAEDRQVAAMRRALTLPSGVPADCKDRPIPPSRRYTPPAPISEADADRNAARALERAGESAAKCTKKQYGTGWVTVCE